MERSVHLQHFKDGQGMRGYLDEIVQSPTDENQIPLGVKINVEVVTWILNFIEQILDSHSNPLQELLTCGTLGESHIIKPTKPRNIIWTLDWL